MPAPTLRRLVLPLALALASGCALKSDAKSGGVDLYWTFWSQSLGNIGASTDTATSICTAAAVDDVLITFTDPSGRAQPVSTDPCIPWNDVPGAAFVGLAPGTWSYLLEARRAGSTVYEASGSFSVTEAERTRVDVRLTPLPGYWDVVVTATTTGCVAGDRLDFDLLSTYGGARVTVFSTRDAAVNPVVTVPCAVTGPITIPAVAPGPLEFSDWLHVDSTGTVVRHHATCRPAWMQSATVSAAEAVSVTAATAPLAGNAGVCP